MVGNCKEMETIIRLAQEETESSEMSITSYYDHKPAKKTRTFST
jgi:hypothetical protein